MATGGHSAKPDCDFCSHKIFESSVVGFCESCYGNLCDSCYADHQQAKAFTFKFSDKVVASKEQLIDLTRERCTNHENERVILYCEDHDEVGCGICLLKKHRSCDKVVHLDDIKKDDTTLEEVNAHINHLNDLEECLKSIEMGVKENKGKNEVSLEACNQGVSTFRKRVDENLDKLQSALLKDIERKHLHNTAVLTTVSSICKEALDVVRERQSELDMLNETNHYARMYLQLTRNTKELSKVNSEIKRARNTNHIKTYEFKENNKLKAAVFTDIKDIGCLEEMVDGSEDIPCDGQAIVVIPPAVSAAKQPNPSQDERCDRCKQTMSITQSSSVGTKKLSCGHVFHTSCAVMLIKAKQPCIKCGIVTGDQPSGTMNVSKSILIKGCIDINYTIPDGIQGSEHPNPGEPYSGMTKCFYTFTEHTDLCRMLKLAFQRRLVFTIGRAGARRGKDQVEWNIHHEYVWWHKLTNHDEVTNRLKLLGITPNDIDSQDNLYTTVSV